MQSKRKEEGVNNKHSESLTSSFCPGHTEDPELTSRCFDRTFSIFFVAWSNKDWVISMLFPVTMMGREPTSRWVEEIRCIRRTGRAAGANAEIDATRATKMHAVTRIFLFLEVKRHVEKEKQMLTTGPSEKRAVDGFSEFKPADTLGQSCWVF